MISKYDYQNIFIKDCTLIQNHGKFFINVAISFGKYQNINCVFPTDSLRDVTKSIHIKDYRMRPIQRESNEELYEIVAKHININKNDIVGLSFENTGLGTYTEHIIKYHYKKLNKNAIKLGEGATRRRMYSRVL